MNNEYIRNDIGKSKVRSAIAAKRESCSTSIKKSAEVLISCLQLSFDDFKEVRGFWIRLF